MDPILLFSIFFSFWTRLWWEIRKAKSIKTSIFVIFSFFYWLSEKDLYIYRFGFQDFSSQKCPKVDLDTSSEPETSILSNHIHFQSSVEVQTMVIEHLQNFIWSTSQINQNPESQILNKKKFLLLKKKKRIRNFFKWFSIIFLRNHRSRGLVGGV